MEYNARAPSSASFFGHTHTQQPASSSSSSSNTPGSSAGYGSSGSSGSSNNSASPRTHPQFDVITWYPKYQSCQRYFLEVAQHTYPCQALAAFINIRLPFQRQTPGQAAGGAAVGVSSRPPQQAPSPFRPPGAYAPHPTVSAYGWVSLHPYVRRLVATGFDVPAILHGWFGDDWESGVGPLHEQERRNYLFAAKSGGWASVKKEYDVVMDEAVPYLMPLKEVGDAEIESAEGLWSKWLAMEDWMLGARAPMQGDGHMDV